MAANTASASPACEWRISCRRLSYMTGSKNAKSCQFTCRDKHRTVQQLQSREEPTSWSWVYKHGCRDMMFSLTFLPSSTLITCLFNVMGQSSFCSRHNPSILDREGNVRLIPLQLQCIFIQPVFIGTSVIISEQQPPQFITCQCYGNS